ncbi:MAG: SRPBCC domain-containing protein, partial [Planctomycetota bacterium]
MTIRRTIRATRDRVFDAWTRPEHLRNWWRVHPKWTTEIAEIDLRVGGKYRLGMRDPAQEGPFVCGGEFVEVTPPAKLVYTWAWESAEMDVGETLV